MRPELLQSTYPRRRRVLLRAAGLAGTALMAAALLAWNPQPASGWNQSSAEGTLWQLLNGARVNNGLNPLQQNGTLISLARWRSKDMVDRDYFDHVVLGTGYKVFHWYDLNGLSYSWGGENIGWNNGYADADSPVAVHEGFMNSPSHRANVLEPSFTHGGVGAYAADNVSFLGKLRNPRLYTELFMTAKSSTPPPPPPPPPSSKPPTTSSGGSSSTPAPVAATLHVDSPAPPTPDAEADAPVLVVRAPQSESTAAVRAVAWADPTDAAANPPAQLAAAPYRVEAAAASRQGPFETVFGSLLSFFFG